jgi:hypothetical protein
MGINIQLNIQLNIRPCTTYKGDSTLTPCRLRSGFERVSSESVSLPR